MIFKPLFSRSSFTRNVASMPGSSRPAEPWVAIMGTTGTGKSDLAVDLALRFNGEIINADAMQMYSGLPVITNQISLAEQKGVPHHLLARISLDQPTWTVGLFAREATKLIREIRNRGKLPIVVGGTHYYINALLFEHNLVDNADDTVADDRQPGYTAQTAADQQHPILAGPTDLILKRLQEVDPAMAQRWHPNDRRKIRRSLEIFLMTGKKASDIYAEQQTAKQASDSTNSPWQALMFWVYANPKVLKDRLDKRVDKMEQSGLLEEARDLHVHLQQSTAGGQEVDRNRGIWQSIGFKQLEPFLNAENEEIPTADLLKLKTTGMEDMKTATRQYARYQLRWLRTKTIPMLHHEGRTAHFYLLDSSDTSRFSDNVLAPAADILGKFLGGLALPSPVEVSESAKEVLSAMEKASTAPKMVTQAKVCELCRMTLVTDEEWERHIKGQRHRRELKHRSRTALVSHEGGTAQRAQRDSDSRRSSPDLDLAGFP